MSNNRVVIDTLVKKREQLQIEKVAAISRFDNEIQELEAAIETLSGERSWEIPLTTLYDDEHPEYIKQSIED
jgi:hypothetical protein